jgi:hypothetical protein
MESWHQYARGLKGIALLLLRGSVAALVLMEAQKQGLFTEPSAGAILLGAIGVGLGLGILTALCSITSVVGGLILLVSHHVTLSGLFIVTLILCSVIAILGPGAYSVDSVLFGRRRVVL